MLEMQDNSLALVIGGASSGKSAFAENLGGSTGRPRVYIATAQAYDAEMEAKIEQWKFTLSFATVRDFDDWCKSLTVVAFVPASSRSRS